MTFKETVATATLPELEKAPLTAPRAVIPQGTSLARWRRVFEEWNGSCSSSMSKILRSLQTLSAICSGGLLAKVRLLLLARFEPHCPPHRQPLPVLGNEGSFKVMMNISILKLSSQANSFTFWQSSFISCVPHIDSRCQISVWGCRCQKIHAAMAVKLIVHILP